MQGMQDAKIFILRSKILDCKNQLTNCKESTRNTARIKIIVLGMHGAQILILHWTSNARSVNIYDCSGLGMQGVWIFMIAQNSECKECEYLWLLRTRNARSVNFLWLLRTRNARSENIYGWTGPGMRGRNIYDCNLWIIIKSRNFMVALFIGSL
jgi:hypothetical protein